MPLNLIIQSLIEFCKVNIQYFFFSKFPPPPGKVTFSMPLNQNDEMLCLKLLNIRNCWVIPFTSPYGALMITSSQL